MRRRGFTLLELTVVISIIAILAAILFPVYARAREHARQSTCASNLMQIGGALSLYAQTYDGRLPRKNNDFGPLYPYSSCVDVFYCPSDSQEHNWKTRTAVNPGIARDRLGREYTTVVSSSSSYVYRGGLTNDDRADTLIAGEVQVFHGVVVNVLYLGGYVKGVPAETYKPIVPPGAP